MVKNYVTLGYVILLWNICRLLFVRRLKTNLEKLTMWSLFSTDALCSILHPTVCTESTVSLLGPVSRYEKIYNFYYSTEFCNVASVILINIFSSILVIFLFLLIDSSFTCLHYKKQYFCSLICASLHYTPLIKLMFNFS